MNYLNFLIVYKVPIGTQNKQEPQAVIKILDGKNLTGSYKAWMDIYLDWNNYMLCRSHLVGQDLVNEGTNRKLYKNKTEDYNRF